MKLNEFIKKYNMRVIDSSDKMIIDMPYCTKNNFTKEVLYDNNVCLLRASTAEKLIKANNSLLEKGLRIKVWDAFRPLSVQYKMWDIFPDSRFVADPKTDKSNHCKGTAVDVTLCDIHGNELNMPTEFDHFGEESYRDYYEKLDYKTKENVTLLENIMIQYGFKPFVYEWWHFNDTDEYDVIKENFEL